ncbi:MAG: DUF3047 domain-containing protein [Vicinamibacterales bacterium]|nr:DUF3047 domain-containing protein [Vicinamibacterales bacterium]MDP6607733.1 DUF3047 domain-containing protein [Vicinamibacterales bacterium]HAK55816.1 hypothetical protein [Acidobacteriota bacterium]
MSILLMTPRMLGRDARRLVLCGLAAAACACSPERANVLVPDGSATVTVMDFREPFSLDPLPEGWQHRTFWRHRPMEMSFTTKAGVPAMRFATRDTASMLFRHVRIDLGTYPHLSWRWFIETEIDGTVDERTREGDDHSARFFLSFATADGETRRMEIIWANRRFAAGEYKFLGSFPHDVANGGAANVGRWHDETVNLAAIYRELWGGDPLGVTLVDLGVFCDSDDTGAESVAYIADVRVSQSPPA